MLLDIGGVRYPMTKDADGWWTGVYNAQEEGFHYYQLNVDGVNVPDPGTLMFSESICRIEKRLGEGLSISPDGRSLLFGADEFRDGNLYMVENTGKFSTCLDFRGTGSRAHPLLPLLYTGPTNTTADYVNASIS